MKGITVAFFLTPKARECHAWDATYTDGSPFVQHAPWGHAWIAWNRVRSSRIYLGLLAVRVRTVVVKVFRQQGTHWDVCMRHRFQPSHFVSCRCVPRWVRSPDGRAGGQTTPVRASRTLSLTFPEQLPAHPRNLTRVANLCISRSQHCRMPVVQTVCESTDRDVGLL